MNVKYLGSALTLGSFVALGVACGDSGDGGGAGGTADVTNSTSTTGATKATSTTSSVNVSSSSTGVMADGNNTFETATELMPDGNGIVDVPADGTYELNPISEDAGTTDVDWYKFPASAGVLLINAAHGDMASTDGDIDTFIGLYDSNQNLLASNDDSYPRFDTRSQIITHLPADGTYYLKVEEFCNSVDASDGCDAAYFASKTQLSYSLQIGPGDVFIGFDSEVEPNDAAATATVAPNEAIMGMPGNYYFSHLDGAFASAADADWYSVTVPADLAVEATFRPQLSMIIPFGTPAGNGSKTKVGLVSVYDATGATLISTIDFSAEPNAQFGTTSSRAEFAVPVIAGNTYTVKVDKGPAEAMGISDFYFVYRGLGQGDQVEAAEATNGTVAGAEVPTQLMLIGGPGYRVEGNLGDADVDYYRLGTNNLALASIFCDGQRIGSGVRGLKATLFKADGTTQIGTATETAADSITLSDQNIAGEANVILRVEKTSQDAAATGDFYRCAAVVSDM